MTFGRFISGGLLALLLPGVPLVRAGTVVQTITVTGNAEYPPLTWRDRDHPERLTGFAIELLETALKGSGIQVESRFVGPWARAQDNVRHGRVDMLAGAYLTAERTSYMDYITPAFIADPTVVFVRKGDTLKFDTWEDLVGLKGGAPIGNSYGEAFDQFEKSRLDIERVPLVSQAFDKLNVGRNRYVVYGLYPGLAEAEAEGIRDRIDYLPKSIISEGLYFTLSKVSRFNTPEFRQLLARRIRVLAKEKLPEKLMDKYLKLWKAQSEVRRSGSEAPVVP